MTNLISKNRIRDNGFGIKCNILMRTDAHRGVFIWANYTVKPFLTDFQKGEVTVYH